MADSNISARCSTGYATVTSTIGVEQGIRGEAISYNASFCGFCVCDCSEGILRSLLSHSGDLFQINDLSGETATGVEISKLTVYSNANSIKSVTIEVGPPVDENGNKMAKGGDMTYYAVLTENSDGSEQQTTNDGENETYASVTSSGAPATATMTISDVSLTPANEGGYSASVLVLLDLKDTHWLHPISPGKYYIKTVFTVVPTDHFN